ncbi:MAG: coproporphyrinogen III oxidase, partial [Leptospirales bacterium]|nr:coproporphyrinogen III oxidase [Leptospirales bacterium]
ERGHVLSIDDRIRRDVIRHLMCYARLDYATFERGYGIDFKHYFAEELKSLADFQPAGIVREQTDGLTLSEEGRFLVRNVAMVFDKYSSSLPSAFSRTV